MKWYKVTLFGWFFAMAHLVLSALIVYGRISFEPVDPAYYLYRAAFLIHLFLLILFFYARFKREKLFAAK